MVGVVVTDRGPCRAREPWPRRAPPWPPPARPRWRPTPLLPLSPTTGPRLAVVVAVAVVVMTVAVMTVAVVVAGAVVVCGCRRWAVGGGRRCC